MESARDLLIRKINSMKGSLEGTINQLVIAHDILSIAPLEDSSTTECRQSLKKAEYELRALIKEFEKKD